MRNKKIWLTWIGIAAVATLLIALFCPASFHIFGSMGEEKEEAEVAIDSFIRISPYDIYFRQYADSIDWDWKLLAAIGYAESQFDTAALSSGGARGIMQVMPRTAETVGVSADSLDSPEENIKAAAYYLRTLEQNFKRIKNHNERMNFILSSYNAGLGHILDAMDLAQKNNRNRHIWKNHVDTFLLLKGEEAYYTDSVCSSGSYMSGEMTNAYVNKVLRRWARYQRLQKLHTDSIAHLPTAARKDTIR